ncbi:MAG: hypothetical protein JETCAE02_28810 [Anaerolineaceae bacterium]|nr:MAG: hypothetical protein JETCAE02_28810 [Anaerolineaceae bacterium]
MERQPFLLDQTGKVLRSGKTNLQTCSLQAFSQPEAGLDIAL